mmetsp:Transcript_68929/g.119965  ORF Transcript_68929/g.119965 Transcript_68929/m.119965 type:complete len:88 (-) Transcript_68929:1147-1410(-)
MIGSNRSIHRVASTKNRHTLCARMGTAKNAGINFGIAPESQIDACETESDGLRAPVFGVDLGVDAPDCSPASTARPNIEGTHPSRSR